MKNSRTFLLAVLFIILLPALVWAEQSAYTPPKFALIIGNGDYNGLSPLANPVNDANDVAATLQDMGFVVEKVLNGSLDTMENAVLRLQDLLSQSPLSYGFFFYAGHGVQSGGDNFLIPVDSSIPSESFLRTRALSVQAILDELNEARNSLNVVVLDACRDNPFGWARSTGRGLAVITGQPADSIIVYATSAGQRAFDGEGRNGVFTTQLLKNLKTPGLEVNELFRRTGADVAEASNRGQIPAIYNQFFGTAYLGTASEEALASAYQPSPARPSPQLLPSTAGNDRKGNRETQLWTIGASLGSTFTVPWVIVTARGTLAPFNYSFLEMGLDLGLVSGVKNVGYYSIFPFAHYCYFMPVRNLGGWYAGAGAGCLLARLSYPEGDVAVNVFVFEASAGFNFLDFLDVSYTLRTNFKAVNHKISAGYTYRFK